ncbi:MAG: exodeoxyribonuclease III, partial [Alphaproteobacteria bacterium]
MIIKISTWNVNGVRARIDVLTSWLKNNQPDILCLQETKCVNEEFPKDHFESMGYIVYLNGQKSFNGVAILSKYELTDLDFQIYHDKEEEQARFIEAVLKKPNNLPFKINCIYLPNGNPYPSEKFDYKLDWMDRLVERAKKNISLELPYIILGDFNIIPTEEDVYD